MKCPVCVEEGLISKVWPQGGSRTSMYCSPYWDEDGVYHHHDRNTVVNGYKCSYGHNFVETGYEKCPGCEFGGMEIKTVN